MRYDAFISYSHAADDTLAPAVQRGLQLLARPWNKRRALEVFRDDTGLAVSPGLWTSICAGLDESQYFVLLASPEAAASTWVNQEVQHWSASHPIDCLLPVVTAGEWVWDAAAGDFDWARSTSVPKALRGLFSEEPRHLDLRWAHSETDLDLRNSRFKEAVAQLAAPMHAMAPEDIEGADVARHKRLVQVRRAVVASLTVLLVLVSVAGVLALRYASTAHEQSTAAQQSEQAAQQVARQRLADKLLAQAELEDRRNDALGLLLRAQAARLSPQDSWGALVSSVGANPGLMKLYDLPREAQAARWHALSPDGDLFAWATERGPLHLWDLPAGRASRHPLTCAVLATSPCAPLGADTAVFGLAATDLAFSPTGVLAAAYPSAHEHAVLGSGGIVLWNTDTGSGHLLPQSSQFAGMAFDADGGRVAGVDLEGTVRVWDTRTHQIEATLPAPSTGPPTDVAFSRDATLLFESVRGIPRIFVWTLDGPRAGMRLPALRLPAGYPTTLVAGAHGVLASLDRTGGVIEWDTRARKPLGPLATGGAAVTDLAFAADGTLATVGRDGLVRLWDPATRAQLAHTSRAGDGGSAAQLAFTPDGRRLISVFDDVRVWDVSQWGRSGHTLYQHQGVVTAVAVSSTGLLATGDEHGGIWLSALDHPEVAPQILQRRGSAIGALDFSAAGVLAVGSADGIVGLWDTSTGQPIGNGLDGHGDAVASVSFAPDGRLLAVAYRRPSSDDAWPRTPIRVWDTESKLVQQSLLAGLAADVNDLDFSPLAELAAAGRDFGGVWDPSTWGSTTLPADATADYFAVAFSADGSKLVFSEHEAESIGYRVSVWDVPDRSARPEPLGESALPGPPPAALALGLADSLIAGAGPGGVQLWDAAGLQPIGRPLGASATSIAFSADEGQLIVGQQDGLVQTYPASVEGWQDAVCSIVGRNLTHVEWATFAGDDEPYAKTCPQYG